MNMTKTDAGPWYREPWPWLLMAGPAAVVVAGIVTLWIAISTSDGMVVDDYYKRGMAINQTIQRDVLAAQRGYRATALVAADGRAMTVQLSAAVTDAEPPTLRVLIVHPTRDGLDKLVLLRRVGSGVYNGVVPAVTDGRRILVLEDMESTWRLTGETAFPAGGPVVLKPANRQ